MDARVNAIPADADADALADQAAIARLTHDYCWALDTKDWEALRDVFVPDVVAHLSRELHGVDAVIERISGALGPLDDSQHLVATHRIDVEGDTATGRCYLQAQHVRRGTEGGDNFMVGGRYEDRYVRTPEGWRIAERRLVVMWVDGNRAVVRFDG